MTWPSYLETVRIGGALPVWFAASDLLESGAESATVYMEVPCIDGGGWRTIHRTIALPPFDEATAPQHLFDAAAWMYRHELKEQMTVDGSRPFDPGLEHEP